MKIIIYEKICVVCAKTFTTHKSYQKYCSKLCHHRGSTRSWKLRKEDGAGWG